MRYILILTALLLTATISNAQRRYYHEIDNAIVRVDEQYPGAFAEHRYIPSGADNLFRAFLAFADSEGRSAWGSAHVREPFFTSSFKITDSLDIFEYYYTIIDTDSTGAPADTDSVLIRSETLIEYADTAFGILVTQRVVAVMDTNKRITAEFILKNIRPTAISGLRAVFFYDGDIPDYLYNDDYPEAFPYLSAVGVRDGTTGITSGFCGLKPRSGMLCGARRDWVDTLVAPDSSLIFSMVSATPLWPTSPSAGDWSSYGLWLFPTLSAGAVETLSVAFIAGNTADNFAIRAAAARGDSVIPFVAEQSLPVSPAISISPNPFNSSCRISLSEPSEIAVFDISGRLVRDFANTTNLDWDGKDKAGNELPAGVYLISAGAKASARAVLIK